MNGNVRKSSVKRVTNETSIEVELVVDGSGASDIRTGAGFFDHMLTALCHYAMFDLRIRASGDYETGAHHTVEDVGICVGKALAEALGDRAGIRRFGDRTVPLDDSLVMAALDLGGRSYLGYDVTFLDPTQELGSGGFQVDLIEDFFRAFSSNGGFNLHLKALAGKNAHHIAECCFKAVGLALREAVEMDGKLGARPLSTKGVIEV